MSYVICHNTAAQAFQYLFSYFTTQVQERKQNMRIRACDLHVFDTQENYVGKSLSILLFLGEKSNCKFFITSAKIINKN